MNWIGRRAALALLLLAGCTKDPEFPAAIPDAQYFNGHPMALNAPEDAAWEDELVRLTNEKRSELGLGQLGRSRALDALARAHSVHMEQHFFFDHLNPEGDVEAGRMSKFTKAAFVIRENIWIVEPGKTPQYVLDGFLASPSHRDNLLSYGHLVGVGIVRRPYNSIPDHIYVTMEFVELR